jgi:excisionase family DNA binding protein
MLDDVDELFKGKPFLSLSEVAQLLSCAEEVVYNWTRRPDLKKRPPKITVGKEVRFPKREFLRWLAQEQGAGSAT